MPDLLPIAYAAGYQVEQVPGRGTCAVKREHGLTVYSIPLDDFEAIVKAALAAGVPGRREHASEVAHG